MAGLMLTNLLVAQNPNIKKGAVGFKVSYLDFKKTNLTEGLSTGVPAFGIQYFKGINSKLDFMTNLDLASIKYPYYTSLKIPAAKSNHTYAAIDFNLNFKLVKDDKKIVPYLTAGIGLGADRIYIADLLNIYDLNSIMGLYSHNIFLKTLSWLNFLNPTVSIGCCFFFFSLRQPVIGLILYFQNSLTLSMSGCKISFIYDSL